MSGRLGVIITGEVNGDTGSDSIEKRDGFGESGAGSSKADDEGENGGVVEGGIDGIRACREIDTVRKIARSSGRLEVDVTRDVESITCVSEAGIRDSDSAGLTRPETGEGSEVDGILDAAAVFNS